MSARRVGTPERSSSAPSLVCFVLLFVLPILILGTAGCNQSLQAGQSVSEKSHGTGLPISPIDPPPSRLFIEVTPSSPIVNSGAQIQFTAAVRGSADPAIIWSANGGTISETGLFLAPQVGSPQVVRVVATSLADRFARGYALVSVSPAPPALPPVLTITTSALPGATAGVLYTTSLNATGGAPPYQWSIASGSLPSGLQLDLNSGVISGTAPEPGTLAFSAQVMDSAKSTRNATFNISVAPGVSSTGSNFDGPAELPRVYLQTTLADTPAPGHTTYVAAGGDLQAALNAANCGDTIQLQSDATFSGLFRLPGKGCDDQHWIIIRSSAADSGLPPEGTRLTPCYAGVASLPGRPAYNCPTSQRVIPQIIYSGKGGNGPIVLSAGANHYRLLGLELTRAAGTGAIGALVVADSAATADHIVLDRVWLHGTAQDDTGRGVHLNRITYAAMVDSYFTDFHCTAVVGACIDSQTIAGGSGDYPAGPYKIVNNFLEAAAENILFGGGHSTTTPSDIEIRRNHLFKPLPWMPGAPGFMGGASGYPFIVKNHFELKNAQRVLFEGNVLENSWGGFTQSGYSIVLTPKGNTATKDSMINRCSVCQVTDVTIRHNTISHVGGGFDIATALTGNGFGVPALAGARYSIHDVTVDDIDKKRYNGHGGLVSMLNGWPENPLNSVTIDHITGFPDPTSHVLSLLDIITKPPMWGFVFTNNIVGSGTQPVVSAGAGLANCATHQLEVLQNLSTCFTTYVFSHNALLGVPASYPPSTWPSNNFFAATSNDAQFVNFNNGNGGDYQLLPSSPYKNAGSDGKDLGADIGAIQAAIAGVY